MNSFDFAIIRFVIAFANRSEAFDRLVLYVANADLLKGGALITVLWWAWFRHEGKEARSREIVLATLAGCLVALFLARALALVLPFRLRPVLAFPAQGGPRPEHLYEWSAFPSDHATLFFALATGLTFTARRLGALVLAYVVVAICLPRIYLGWHYPTDVIAGAVLGSAVAYGANTDAVRAPIARRCFAWRRQHPGLFYAAFFLLGYQIATLFSDLRELGIVVLKLMR